MKNKVDEVYNKSKKGLCIFLAFVMCVSLLSFAGSYRKAAAEEKNIEFDVENIKDYNVSIHDSGVFTLVNYTSEKGDVESVKWSVSDENIMKVTDIENLGAQYEALSSGKVDVYADITIKGTGIISDSAEDTDNGEDNTYDESTYYDRLTFSVFVYPDMSNVELVSSSQTKYMSSYDYNTEFDFKLKSDIALDGENQNIDFDYKSSNSSMSVSAKLKNNVVSIWAYKPGKTTVTFTIYGATFNVYINVIKVKINRTYLVLIKGKSSKLSIKGISKGIKWKSLKSSVVKVNGKGKIKARKVGTSVIVANIGGAKVGCAVSVVTPKTYRVIRKAKSIAKGTYSQPKRMERGYYDCSSLVWRAYSRYGTYFGARSYAPVAADICRWCMIHHKKVSGKMTEGQIQKMKFRAGDLIFKPGAKNGRYKGVYHVEMFTGYRVTGFTSKGKPVLSTEWANRTTGYDAYGSIVERP